MQQREVKYSSWFEATGDLDEHASATATPHHLSDKDRAASPGTPPHQCKGGYPEVPTGMSKGRFPS